MNMEEIPIIDLSRLCGEYKEVDKYAFEEIAKQFGQAMHTVGFAYLVNHGVDMNKIEHINTLSKVLFTQPQEVKSKYRKTDAVKSYHGYAGPGEELQNNVNEGTKQDSVELKEGFDVSGPDQYDESKFPKEVPGYKASFDAVRPECNNLGKKLLRCMAIFLDLEDEEFFVRQHKYMDDPSIRTQSQFRCLHYFQMDPNDPSIPPNAIRIGEHSDWGTISLLFQDMVGGLEVKRLDGTWIEAISIKDSILINGAQLMELWSAGIFPATPHRVRIVDNERTRKLARQSFIYFINPDGDTVVKPVVKCPPGNPEFLTKTPVNAFDHYTRLIKMVYGKH